jgi:hypothetical protein
MTATSAIADANERREILSEILRADLTDFTGANGDVELTKDTPNRRAASALSVTRRVNRDGEEVVTRRLKLHDKLQAADILNKMDRLYTPEQQTFNDVKIMIVHDAPRELSKSEKALEIEENTS